MPTYQRTKNIDAVQFFEEEFLSNKDKYPDVRDRANFSSLWSDKNSSDGRYYIPTEKDNFFSTEYTNVYEGDFILKEEEGNLHTLPSTVFEANYALINK
ncbi:hypothetical protein [Priestia aryabhattai]